jgi:chloramphenicol 3-O phosphotransferase
VDAVGRGRVIVLNGGSSSGKTALARKLQIALGDSWLVVGIDLFMWTLPSRLFADPDGITVSNGVIARGDEYMRLYAAFQRATAALAEHGADVLVDDVFLAGGADQRLWSASLGDLDVCWIGVRCAPNVAEQRELARGDRISGAARAQSTTVHDGVRYDFEVDTGELEVERAAAAVTNHLHDRWPQLSVTAATVPYEYPLTSAFEADGSIRPAPWELRPEPGSGS